MSCGPEALYGCVFEGGSLGIGRGWCLVSSAFNMVVIGLDANKHAQQRRALNTK
jgi:hypothetical protein